MSTNNLLQRIEKFRNEQEQIKKTFIKEARSCFFELCSNIFTKHSWLTSFGWEQYTPHFNDGDSCEFSIYADEPNINGICGQDIDFSERIPGSEYEVQSLYTKPYIRYKYRDVEEKEFENEYTEEKFLLKRKEVEEASSEISELIYGLGDYILEDIFGDHVEVTIYRDGTHETKDYNHD